MKRYLAFYGDVFYPSGGINDLIGHYDSKEEAINAIHEEHNKYCYNEDYWGLNWAHVYDKVDELKVYIK